MSLLHQQIMLSSGLQFPLAAVSRNLAMLRQHLDSGITEKRVVLYELRQLCLGRKVSPAAQRNLKDAGFLSEDGTMEPVLKGVVLSALQGEGYGLYVISPFTSSLDRTLAEYIQSRERILAEVPENDAKRFLFGENFPGEVHSSIIPDTQE